MEKVKNENMCVIFFSILEASAWLGLAWLELWYPRFAYISIHSFRWIWCRNDFQQISPFVRIAIQLWIPFE